MTDPTATVLGPMKMMGNITLRPVTSPVCLEVDNSFRLVTSYHCIVLGTTAVARRREVEDNAESPLAEMKRFVIILTYHRP